MSEASTPNNLPVSPFEAIRHQDEAGEEFWSARELARVLGYKTNYRNFKVALKKAEQACHKSGQRVAEHFAQVRNMFLVGNGARREVEDVALSRYACYLVVQNADPTKEMVALGQTYFAVQTHRQETSDELFASLSEEQKRLYVHRQMAAHNRQLADTVREAGVVQPEELAVFHEHGYMGLYGGLTSDQIRERKRLAAEQDIQDHMGSEELVANLFRASQTDAKLRRESIRGQEAANLTHREIGQAVRTTIEQIGGTMPEDLPTPPDSIQQIEAKIERKKLLKSAASRPEEPERPG